MLCNTNKQMLTYRLLVRNLYAAATVMSVALTVGQCKQNPCDTFAIVRDQTGLDGCGILLETEKDGLLLPQNFDQLNMAALDGDTVVISYTIVKDAMSICMAENAVVNITCIAMASNVSCDELKDPFAVDWAREAMQATSATEVSLISSNPRSFYMFRGKEVCRLYDCSGTMLCEGACGSDDVCVQYFQNRRIKTKEPKVIYVMNE